MLSQPLFSPDDLRSIAGAVVVVILGALAGTLCCICLGCLGPNDQPHTGPDGTTWDF